MKYLDGAKPTIEKLQELADYLNTTTDYLLYGSEESRSYEIENNNGNQFVKLPDGQFLMTMPIVSVEAQAGFLDFYGDVEYLAEMPKHSMVVDEVHRGHYIAFVVAGDSMDNYTPESFMAGDIVSTRESQRINWTDKLRIKDFPYWVIYTI
ncbi:hypothetical protein [uncultured Proteiniphilum sp.]|jgi:hypothetical protein|uniref:hypothetical protein n=1 Tax=uncultured Proteiniphilum sp. TaxID=497637 RepID=UPI00260AC374|nr:hypothetical protein [uncultured Proteiniphilum sp.]